MIWLIALFWSFGSACPMVGSPRTSSFVSAFCWSYSTCTFSWANSNRQPRISNSRRAADGEGSEGDEGPSFQGSHHPRRRVVWLAATGNSWPMKHLGVDFFKIHPKAMWRSKALQSLAFSRKVAWPRWESTEKLSGLHPSILCVCLGPAAGDGYEGDPRYPPRSAKAPVCDLRLLWRTHADLGLLEEGQMEKTFFDLHIVVVVASAYSFLWAFCGVPSMAFQRLLIFLVKKKAILR